MTKTDWPKLLLELRSKRITAKAIAGLVGTGAHLIYALIDGRKDEPPHSVGEKIRELHDKLCGTN